MLATLLVLCGPAATWLQSREAWAVPMRDWGAVYLVCGARAQDRRIQALLAWLPSYNAADAPSPVILIGNDPQKSLWCHSHQTNHTRTAWAVEKLASTVTLPLAVIPGSFHNTDGEMQALAAYLQQHTNITSVAMVTSRFHARRLLQRYHTHIGDHPPAGIVPGLPRWQNRAPWIVALEYLKLLRDRLGLTHLISRPAPSESPRPERG